MSAIHTGTIGVRTLKNGLLEFTGTSSDRPITDWTVPKTDQDDRVLIPAQRAGRVFNTVVLVANGGEVR